MRSRPSASTWDGRPGRPARDAAAGAGRVSESGELVASNFMKLPQFIFSRGGSPDHRKLATLQRGRPTLPSGSSAPATPSRLVYS